MNADIEKKLYLDPKSIAYNKNELNIGKVSYLLVTNLSINISIDNLTNQ